MNNGNIKLTFIIKRGRKSKIEIEDLSDVDRAMEYDDELYPMVLGEEAPIN